MKNRGLSILLRILSGSNVAEENIRFAIEIVMNPYYRFYSPSFTQRRLEKV